MTGGRSAASRRWQAAGRSRCPTAAPGLVAITLTELNPHNAAADDGLLERFAASFAAAIGSGPC
jgi:hypothetical protein